MLVKGKVSVLAESEMDCEFKEKIDRRIAIFNRVAAEYDDHMNDTGHVQAEKYLLKEVLSDAKGIIKIADIACGTGISTDILQSLLKPTKIIGLDICDQMLRIAKEKFRSEPRVSLKQMDAESLPPGFWGGEFDLISVIYGASWFDIAKVIPVMNILLSAKGHVVIVDDIDLPDTIFSKYYPDIKQNVTNVRKIIKMEQIEQIFSTNGFKKVRTVHVKVADTHTSYAMRFQKHNKDLVVDG